MSDRVCSMGTRGCQYIGSARHECAGAPIPEWRMRQIRQVVREELAKAVEGLERAERNAMRRLP